jgi:hypothetical protein
LSGYFTTSDEYLNCSSEESPVSVGLIILLVAIGAILFHIFSEQIYDQSRTKAHEPLDWQQENAVHPHTRSRAIALAGHDLERVERLLTSVRRHSPGRVEQWYWEKIVHDLERDRKI